MHKTEQAYQACRVFQMAMYKQARASGLSETDAYEVAESLLRMLTNSLEKCPIEEGEDE